MSSVGKNERISIPYDEDVKQCVECHNRALCRILFKAKRDSEESFSVPLDAGFFCYNCSVDKLCESLKIRKTPFISRQAEQAIWVELRLTNDDGKFFD